MIAALEDLAPSGTLRVGIAVGQTIGAGLVVMECGRPRGIAVDLGTELARRLGVPVEFVPYPGPGPLAAAAVGGQLSEPSASLSQTTAHWSSVHFPRRLGDSANVRLAFADLPR